MGRGGGCVSGKLKINKCDDRPEVDKDPHLILHEEPESGQGLLDDTNSGTATDVSVVSSSRVRAQNLKIFVVYYSTYGHVAKLAKKVKEGVDHIDGVEGHLYQVPEILSQDVLKKMKAPAKDATVPIISAEELPAADAIIFGFPARYGSMAAQMKAFFDTTGQLWRGQLLAGKLAGFFVSTGTQGGGQETTAWTAITLVAHHGMVFVPIGYTFGAGMFKLNEARGGSPYGASTYAADGTRTPSETELALAEHQGKYTAGILKRIMGSLVVH